MKARSLRLVSIPIAVLSFTSLAAAQLTVGPFTGQTAGPFPTGTGIGCAIGGDGPIPAVLGAKGLAQDAPEGSYLTTRVSFGTLMVGPLGAQIELTGKLQGALTVDDMNGPGDGARVDASVFVTGPGYVYQESILQDFVGVKNVDEDVSTVFCLAQGNYPVSINLSAWVAISPEGNPMVTNTNTSDFRNAGLTVSFKEVEYASYCTSGVSANGCNAVLLASGRSSATAPNGFDLIATADGNRFGLFYYGTAPKFPPTAVGTSSSYLCVQPPVRRTALIKSTGAAGACNGVFKDDLNQRWTAKPLHNPGAGAAVYAQLWYRDPTNTSNQVSNRSNAIWFCVGP
jgi:hypothetical protein